MAGENNPYYVAPVNPMQALMAGQEGYKEVSGAIQENQKKQVREQAAQEIMQGGNPQNALARLLSVGDDKGAATLATVIHNQQQSKYQDASLGLQGQQITESGRHNKALEGQAGATLAETRRQREQSFGLQGQQFAESVRHNQALEGQSGATLAETVRQHNLALEKPTVLPPGSGLVDRKGNVLREPSADGLLDADTLSAMADQYRAGDTSVLTNLGRGAQGAQNIVALRKIIAQKNSALGEGGAEQAQRNAEMFGVKAAARTVGTKGANIDLAATEFNQVLPVVQEASKRVNRTNYPDLNKIIQAYNEKTGDPNIVAFGGGVNTLVNIYARAISPQGVGTVSDKEHARGILQKAWSQGQFDAAVGMMKQEIDAALASPEKVREEQRKRFLSGQPGHRAATPGAPSAPAMPSPPPGTFLVK